MEEEQSENKLKQIHNIRAAHDEDINCVSWHRDINVFASGSDDSFIKLWELVPVKEENTASDSLSVLNQNSTSSSNKESLDDKKLVNKLQQLATGDKK